MVDVRKCFLALAVVCLAYVSSPAAFPSRAAGGLPPPSFQPAAGWLTVTTGRTSQPGREPQVWAITERSNLAALAPFDLFHSVAALSPRGILIWATTNGRGGPTRVFTRGVLPLQLRTFRADHSWEGQPARNIQQRLRWVSIEGWHLDVRIYFGTQQPSRALVAAAQRELDRLRLPGR
jgi:hypothetical protein